MDQYLSRRLLNGKAFSLFLPVSLEIAAGLGGGEGRGLTTFEGSDFRFHDERAQVEAIHFNLYLRAHTSFYFWDIQERQDELAWIQKGRQPGRHPVSAEDRHDGEND